MGTEVKNSHDNKMNETLTESSISVTNFWFILLLLIKTRRIILVIAFPALRAKKENDIRFYIFTLIENVRMLSF